MEIKIKQIGLAAFMKMHGCSLLGYDGTVFLLDDPRRLTAGVWSLDYANSCCQRHDAELLLLRDTVRRYNRS